MNMERSVKSALLESAPRALTGRISTAARERMLCRAGEPLFIADWRRALFIHLEVDPKSLARAVPFELDLWEGRAFLSLVAFTLHGLRPRLGGAIGRLLCQPISTHRFLNLRAYVRHCDEVGIHFLAEWLDNSLAVRLGPPLFGLPYRLGTLNYQHEHEMGVVQGSVESGSGSASLSYEVAMSGDTGFQPCDEGSLDEFLLERYMAFTYRRGERGFFRVWHPPWDQREVQVRLNDSSLLTKFWPWMREARLIGANYSPGANDVWMGRPLRQG